MTELTVSYYTANYKFLREIIINKYGEKLIGEKSKKYTKTAINKFVESSYPDDSEIYSQIKTLIINKRREKLNRFDKFNFKPDDFAAVAAFLNENQPSKEVIKLSIIIFRIPIIKKEHVNNKKNTINNASDRIVYYKGYYQSSDYRITYLWLEINYTKNKVELYYSEDLQKNLPPTYCGRIEINEKSSQEFLFMERKITLSNTVIMFQHTDNRNNIKKAIWLKLHNGQFFSSFIFILIKSEKKEKNVFYKTSIPLPMITLGGERINTLSNFYSDINRIIQTSFVNYYQSIIGKYILVFPYFEEKIRFAKIIINNLDRKHPIIQYIDNHIKINGYLRFINEKFVYFHIPNNSLYGDNLSKGENQKQFYFDLETINNSFIAGKFLDMSKGIRIWAGKTPLIKKTETEIKEFNFEDISITEDTERFNNLKAKNPRLVKYLLK